MEQMITNLGFPIACCIALGAYVNIQNKQNREDSQKAMEDLRQDAKEDKEMLMKELVYSREVNSKLMSTNEIMAKEISSKLDKVLEKVGE